MPHPHILQTPPAAPPRPWTGHRGAFIWDIPIPPPIKNPKLPSLPHPLQSSTPHSSLTDFAEVSKGKPPRSSRCRMRDLPRRLPLIFRGCRIPNIPGIPTTGGTQPREALSFQLALPANSSSSWLWERAGNLNPREEGPLKKGKPHGTTGGAGISGKLREFERTAIKLSTDICTAQFRSSSGSYSTDPSQFMGRMKSPVLPLRNPGGG